jgi:hypothetical protein
LTGVGTIVVGILISFFIIIVIIAILAYVGSTVLDTTTKTKKYNEQELAELLSSNKTPLPARIETDYCDRYPDNC